MRKQRVSPRLAGRLPAAGTFNQPASKGCDERCVGGRERVCERENGLETRRILSCPFLMGDEYGIREEWAGLAGKEGTANSNLSPVPWLEPFLDGSAR